MYAFNMEVGEVVLEVASPASNSTKYRLLPRFEEQKPEISSQNCKYRNQVPQKDGSKPGNLLMWRMMWMICPNFPLAVS